MAFLKILLDEAGTVLDFSLFSLLKSRAVREVYIFSYTVKNKRGRKVKGEFSYWRLGK